MLSLLLLIILGCERPEPLPPKMNHLLLSDQRMVQMDAFRGYLSRPKTKSNGRAVLIIADVLDEESRGEVQKHAGQTVLVIDVNASVSAAKSYLLGLPGVHEIKQVCAMKDCKSLSTSARDPQ